MRNSNPAVVRVTCIVGMLLCLWMGLNAGGGGDFNEFYSASQLAGTGHLYDWARSRELESRNGSIAIPFGRIPVYGVLLKPLTTLPYLYARTVWLVLNVAALIGFALLWPGKRRRDAIMLLCWSCPAAVLLESGQDTGLFLFLVTAGVRLLQSKRDFLAGLVFSLCAAKFHLALGIPIFLLARRRWGALAGGLAGGLVQLAISFAAEGRDWPSHLMQLSKISDFSPAPMRMPNLLGLTHWIPFGFYVEAALALLALAAVWLVARRSPLTVGATAAVTAGLLVSHHAYVYDAVLLLPGVALALRLRAPKFLRQWALLVAIPFPYLFLIVGRWGWVAAQPIINGFSLSLLGLLAFHALKRFARIQPMVSPAVAWENRTA
jgi:hypothetical protein